MTWRFYRNLENSLVDFLTQKVSDDSLVGENGKTVQIRVGRKYDDNWELPCIAVYMESETLNRFEIGSNLRNNFQLIINNQK